MELSPAMIRYVTTGRCPYCNTTILSQEYLTSSKGSLFKDLQAVAKLFVSHPRFINPISVNAPARREYVRSMRESELKMLVPAGANAEITADEHIRCLTCLNQWPIALTEPGTGLFPRRDRPAASSMSINPASLKIPSTSPGESGIPGQTVNLAGYGVVALRQQKQIEAHLSETTETYPNYSTKTPFAKKLTISNSVARTVTLERSGLKAHSANAGITFVGFAAIQGQIQQQVSERYAITTQSTISISQETSFEIPPGAAVEHVVHWKLVSEHGIAILATSMVPSSQWAELPYQVPMRLSFQDWIRDVPLSKFKKRPN